MLLNKKWLLEKEFFPPDLKVGQLVDYPEKVIQFGEGNFMRAFIGWMINEMNLQELFQGRVVLVQPIEEGMCERINEQDGLYTVILRGLQEGVVEEEKCIVTAVSRCIDPYRNWPELLKCAENPDLRYLFSNTTEAGIAYEAETFCGTVQDSFPAKVTAFLYHRFKTFNGSHERGLIIIPCELIDRNGDELKKIVLAYCAEWKLSEEFMAWINNANFFLNSLVDRIVTGFPRETAAALFEELGYEDRLLNTGELYHLWVIESSPQLLAGLPLLKAGLNVLMVPAIKPYRTRKVRLLNGGHTLLIPPAYLDGLNTVKEVMDDRLMATFLRLSLEKEVIPTLDLPRQELLDYTAEVLERFQNPSIRHNLIDIALNSIAKFKVRVLPSLEDYYLLTGHLPELTCYSLAALCVFYRIDCLEETAALARWNDREYPVREEKKVLSFFYAAWRQCDGSLPACRRLAGEILGNSELWGKDLREFAGFTSLLASGIYSILEKGIRFTLEELVETYGERR